MDTFLRFDALAFVVLEPAEREYTPRSLRVFGPTTPAR
jgi:hypothetical protein